MSGEIWDIIIDHLHDDKPALARCGLVQRSWTASSRCHLFLSIKLTDQDTADDLEELLGIGVLHWGVFDRKYTSVVAVYVRHILVHFAGRDSRRWFERVLPILDKLPSLKSLTLMHLYWMSLIGGRSNPAPSHIMARLSTISFHLVTFKSEDEMLSVVASVENLQELHINGCCFSSRDYHTEDYSKRPCFKLDRLQVAGIQVVRPILRWIQVWKPRPALKSLAISSFGRDTRHLVLQLIAANRSTLRRLALQCDGDFKDDDGLCKSVVSITLTSF